MMYLTDEQGQAVRPNRPLPTRDSGKSTDAVTISGETVTFVTGAAGFTGTVGLDKAPVMNRLGDKIGSYWRSQDNLVDGTAYPLYQSQNNSLRPRVTALTETATAADITIYNENVNMEQLFETPSGTREYVLVVRDRSGNQIYGWIDVVATSGDEYVLDIYDAPTSGAQTWSGTAVGTFDNTENLTYEIFEYNTSFLWNTGTVLTTEVAHDCGRSNEDQLRGLANGEFFIDYWNGVIGYKKATTGTSDTADYKTRAETAVSVTSSGAGGATAAKQDTMITALELIDDAIVTEDEVFSGGGGLMMAGVEIDDPTGLAAMTEGDVGNLKGDLYGRLIVTLGTVLSASQDSISTKPVAPSNFNSTAYEASNVVKASAGTLYEVRGYSSAAAGQWIQIHDASSLPADTAVPEDIAKVDADGNFSITYPQGKSFETGIVVCNSSTGPTKTIGAADTWFSGEFE